MLDDFHPYYVRKRDTWTMIDYAKGLRRGWRGAETELIEIPAIWYLSDLPPMMFIKAAPNCSRVVEIGGHKPLDPVGGLRYSAAGSGSEPTKMSLPAALDAAIRAITSSARSMLRSSGKRPSSRRGRRWKYLGS